MINVTSTQLCRCLFIGALIAQACSAKNEAQYHERINVNNKTTTLSEKTPMGREPQPPFPYQEREVSYENQKANVVLAGTLTLPQGVGPFPAVLLISGMGATDRNGTFSGRQPLLVLADHLTRHGFAVLRADKRGVGKSTGKFDFSVTSGDLASDVLAGVAYLTSCPEINHRQIGLLGMSEGGFIASMVAAESKDIAFVVLMSGAVANTIEDLVEQSATQLLFDGASSDLIEKDSLVRKQILELVAQNGDAAQTEAQLRSLLTNYWAQLSDDQKAVANKVPFAFALPKFDMQIAMYNSPWYRFYVTHNASAALSQIKVPLLALNGSLDFMVPDIVFGLITKTMTLANNKNYTTVELPNLNHSFQRCKTGALAEYATAEQTIAFEALDTVSDWVIQHTVTK